MLLPILVHERPELVGLQFTDFSVWAVHNVTTAGDVVSVPVERTKCHYGNEERPCLHATWQGSQAIMTSLRCVGVCRLSGRQNSENPRLARTAF